MSASLSCSRCGEGFEAKRSDALYCDSCKVATAKERAQRYENHQRVSCPGCGKDMVRGANYCLPCENKARVGRYVGNSNPNWKEGRTKSQGYVQVRIKSGTPGKGKGAFYRPEHHIVWEEFNGKPLPKSWVIHHLNGVKDDNRIENLAAMPHNEHHHHPREALREYEKRIKDLEDKLAELEK